MNTDQIRIEYRGNILNGKVRLPLSKSIANRLLILAHLSGHSFPVDEAGQADDVVRMKTLLEKIRDHGHRHKSGICELDCGNAGTVLRFLLPVCALVPGEWMLLGSKRMQERPIGPLAEALQTGGARIQYTGTHGFPPLYIEGGYWTGGDAGVVPGNVSSQFLSSLLMAGPFCKGIQFQTQGKISSRPYLNMTLDLMNRAGYKAEETGPGKFRAWVPEAHRFTDWSSLLEPDWSGASYFYAMAALAPEAAIFLEGLSTDSVQGDAVTAGFFKSFGVESSRTGQGILIQKNREAVLPEVFDADLSDYPDLAMTLAVCCAGLEIPARLRGLGSLRIKESDRLAALQTELHRVGYRAGIEGDDLWIEAGIQAGVQPCPVIETYQDHRMAMAFAPLALRFHTVIIRNPGVVEKSFPLFWEQCQKIGFTCL